MKEQEIKDAVTKLLLAIGEDPGRDGLVDTPRRISEMYGEIFEGLMTLNMSSLSSLKEDLRIVVKGSKSKKK